MEDIRPTAKWANRMLRPLTAVYHRLEKHQEILSFVDTGMRRKERRQSASCDAMDGPKAQLPIFNTECDSDDPAWIPGRAVEKKKKQQQQQQKRRRIRHKYSVRELRGVGRRCCRRVTMRSPEAQRNLPGAVEIATPLLAGKSFPQPTGTVSPPLVASSSGYDNGNAARKTTGWMSRGPSSFPSYRGSWKEALDMSGDTGFMDIARLLDRILIKFLINTTICNNDSAAARRGARSLLSMAVRRLPEFIADEQEAQDEEDDDEDMCDAYFAELEALYAPGGEGWKPLREAVRSQGLYLVSEMLCRGWVTNRVTRWLLEACLRHGHVDAFELLLSKYLATIHTCSALEDSDDMVRLLRIYYFSSTLRGNQRFVYDQLAKLLMRQAISPELMVTRSWKPCVDDAVQSLATEDRDTSAGCFIEAVILSASGVYTTDTSAHGISNNSLRLSPPPPRRKCSSWKKDEAPSCPDPAIQECLNNLTLSLIAALSSMHVVRSHVPGTAGTTKVRELIRYLALAVQRDIENRSMPVRHHVPTFHSLQRGYVLLADCLLQSVETNKCPLSKGGATRRSDLTSMRNLESFCLALASHRETIKELTSLVLEVISCYERASKYTGSHVFEEVRIRVSRLIRLSDTRGLSTLLGKVAVETAMTLAEVTLDPDDNAWAAELQERFASQQQQQQQSYPEGRTGADKQSLRFAGASGRGGCGLYRWEEGIMEWVERTPMSKMKMREVQVPPRSCSPCIASSSCGSEEDSDDESSVVSSAPSTPFPLNKKRRRDPADDSSGRRVSKRLMNPQALGDSLASRVRNGWPNDNIAVVIITSEKKKNDSTDVSDDDDDDDESGEDSDPDSYGDYDDYDELELPLSCGDGKARQGLVRRPQAIRIMDEEESEDELSFLV